MDETNIKERIKEALGEMQKRMDENPEKLAGGNGRFLFDLSADGGGMWNLTIQDGKGTLQEGEISGYDSKLTIKAADYLDMVAGKLKPIAAFMMGKVKIAGDLTKLAVMQFLLEQQK